MKYVWLSCLTICLCLYVTCSKNTGVNNTKTETRTNSAKLYNPGGSPAKHAKVRFYPVNYNPHTGGLAKTLATIDSATTDSTGNYSVTLDTGTYNVLALGDSGMVFQDSITVTKDSAINPPPDTLKTPGGLRGRVRLQPGDDARTVFILFMGTNTWGTPDDSTGKFTVTNMAQGTYRVRILTTLDAYVPKDTALSVEAGKVDSLAHDIVLQYTGVPGPTGLKVSYDTLRQTVILMWNGADTSLIAGYNVYRAIKGQNFSLITQTPLPNTVTIYLDSAVSVGSTYEYRVVSRRASGEESPKVEIPGDTAKVVSSSLVTTTFTWDLNNTIGDTASINDTIKACLVYSNPTRNIEKIVWYADSLNSPAVKQKSDSSLTGKDTLAYWWKQPGNKKIFIKVTDGAGTIWTDGLGVTIIQDIPTVSISGKDTAAINTPVNFTAKTSQKFGSIIRYRWDNGLAPGYDDSTGSTYTFKYLTEGAFTVKVEVMDDDGNTNTSTKTVTITNDKPVIMGLKDTTIRIKDSVVFTVNATDNNGIMQKYYWNFGDGGSTQIDTTNSNTIGHKFPATAIRCSVSVAVADSFGKQGMARAMVTVLQDAPVIAFLSADTIVNFGGTVRCSVYVQQQFGTMTVGIDTTNSGTYKTLGSLGLSGGESYSFSTGNAFAWDSVKVRITDDDGNLVAKGFRARIRPRPLTITSIDSTVNTITVHYSQSQETDFAQYRIYRNTTNAVDTTGELWATITAIGTVSYATPSPSYAWQPRYYRVFQTDSEGVCSAGSNTVYGNIVNSPPPTPTIVYPVHNGDSILPTSPLRWTKCIDINGQVVKYRILINHNNSGYVQFATEIQDTSIQLQEFDMFGMKLKIIAYDSQGDSSTWSDEKNVYIKAIFPSNSYITAIAIDSVGNKWFGTNSGGVLEFDGSVWSTYTTTNGLVSNNVFSITIDKSGNKWFGTNNGGISKFNGTTWTTYTTAVNGLTYTPVNAIAVDRLGNEWFGGGGLSMFDGTTWTTYKTYNVIVNNIVKSIAIDGQGNAWIATGDSGVSYFHTALWTTYTTDDGLANNNVDAVAIDGQGNKWFGFGTYGGGVSRFDGTAWTTYTTSSGLVSNDVFAIAIEGPGITWFATINGVSKFDGTTWSTYTTADGLASNSVSAIAIDKQGIKWFGIDNPGMCSVSKFDGITWTTYK
jgi:Predicted periplasmic ligand-binding sensor domain